MQQRTSPIVRVGAIGLGGMPMSIEGRPDAGAVGGHDPRRARRRRHPRSTPPTPTTCDADEVGHNEELIAGALRSWGGDAATVLVATKGGHLRPGDGSWTRNGDPAYLKQAARASARRLGVDAIGLYQFHRPDPKVPYAESVGALASCSTRASSCAPASRTPRSPRSTRRNEVLGGRLVSVQNQFSPAFRSSRGELEHCAGLGIAFLPWSPLGGISSAGRPRQRRHAAFAEVAQAHGVSPQQVALAWELSLADGRHPDPRGLAPGVDRGLGAGAPTSSCTDDELPPHACDGARPDTAPARLPWTGDDGRRRPWPRSSTDRITQPTDADVTAYLDGVARPAAPRRHARGARADARGHRAPSRGCGARR